ncbi:hypothetical protein [Paraliomyxa miuraensis]|uniref:hypothetical protein n=1 Tax=Paraliomyxa miuraensis TaxID=376150 RepID=UPI00225415D5|nr:hypothetical protein [Paraliomyxa miuraensis]MCX4247057.1 hypothetical protein [Paraliomyxa miuraensis]
MPDANFYRACVPRRWQNHRLPCFFTCGGRSQVLSVFAMLRTKHLEDPAASYLTPDKLYAIIDLDLHVERMPDGYPWSTTEDVHAALYSDGAIAAAPDERHRIWVTALIHKEAFFVLPGVEAAWAHGLPPFFRGAPLSLRVVHSAVSERLKEDVELTERLEVVVERLRRFSGGQRLVCSSGQALGSSWRAVAEHADEQEYAEILNALLAVAKVKPLWSEVVPEPKLGMPSPDAAFFRDQLALNVAAHIARLEPHEHPLASFFDFLAPRR